MKTTAKEYKQQTELRRLLKNWADDARFTESWATRAELQKQIKELDENYFEKLNRVNVKFSIGGRQYYQEVVKIGKTFFDGKRAMTKGRGYWFVTEIPVITEEMSKNMLADSYWY